jgi:predicted ribosome quality control (RQC) complex YloA/Tae2 family protein
MMSLDGRFLSRLGNELNSELSNGRIQKIHQLGRADFLFQIRQNSENKQLVLSVSSGLGRIHLSRHDYDKNAVPSGFVMFLRKHLESGVVLSVASVKGDRVVQIAIQNTNEIGMTVQYSLYLELMGKYTNLIVADGNDIVIDSFLHISPFEENSRALMRGLKYELPEDHKINPEQVDIVVHWLETTPDITPKLMLESIRGTSPLFAAYFFDQFPKQSLPIGAYYKILDSIPTSPTKTIAAKTKFYYFDLFDAGEKTTYPTLSDLLDEYYYDLSRHERMKQIGNNVAALVKRELEKAANKLDKLAADWDAALQADKHRLIGDLIKANQMAIAKGMTQLSVFDYEQDREVTIKLDPLLSPSENLQSTYKKYKKLKAAVGHIQTQIEKTKTDIEYFTELAAQIELADQNDLVEIVDELAKQGYLKAKPTSKKPQKPHVETYLDEAKTIYYVGKNNLQNETVTHKLAVATDWWFHVQKMPGSHVVAHFSGPLTESIVRTAANLAVLQSKARQSASVPVDYTQVRYIKKIPGKKGSFVSYTNQKTIYIDPDPKLKDQLTTKK